MIALQETVDLQRLKLDVFTNGMPQGFSSER
jgi:hypothetical protein